MSVIVSRLTLGNEKKIRTQEVIGEEASHSFMHAPPGSDECMVLIPSPPRDNRICY